TDATVLVLAGTQEDLAAYDAQFQSHEVSEDPVVILGGGRVGRAASRALSEEGVPSTIVELEPGRVENSYSVLEGTASCAVVSGDAADQRILRRAGLETASAVLVTPRDDDLNGYLTLFCPRLRPELQVVSRATYERNVATLDRAGSASVLFYPPIGATDLWHHAALLHHRRARSVEPRGPQPPRPRRGGQRAVPGDAARLTGAPLAARRRGAAAHRLPHRRRARGGRHPGLRHGVDPGRTGEAAAARGPARRAPLPRDLSARAPAASASTPTISWLFAPSTPSTQEDHVVRTREARRRRPRPRPRPAHRRRRPGQPRGAARHPRADLVLPGREHLAVHETGLRPA